MNTGASLFPQQKLQALLVVLGFVGISVIFLPFTFGVSPFKAVFGRGHTDVWRLGMPFFLALLILPGFVRWRFLGKFTRIEGWVGYAAALGSACVTFSLYLDAGGPPWAKPFREAVAMICPVIFAALAFWQTRRNWRMGVPMAACSLICLQAAYLANSVFCLIGFYGEWQVGAWLTLLVSVVYALQVLVILPPAMKQGPSEDQNRIAS